MKIMTPKEVLIEKIVEIIQEAELDNSTDYETQIYLRINAGGTADITVHESVGGSSWLLDNGLYLIGTVCGAYETLGEIWSDSVEELCNMCGLDIGNVIYHMIMDKGFKREDITEKDIYKYLDECDKDIIREEVEDMMNWMYRSEYWVKAEDMLDEWAEDRDVEWMTTTDREEV